MEQRQRQQRNDQQKSTASQQRARKIAKRDLESALNFLETHPIGQRLQAAEHTLTLLLKDQLPRLKQFIFNASFDLCEIADIARFGVLHESSSSLNRVFSEARSGGCIRVCLEKEQVRVILFYETKLNKTEALLFSRSLGEVIAATYAALGLDMTGIISIDAQVIGK